MKIVNPHLILTLADPWCGASWIEIHDTFAIAYYDPDRSHKRYGPINEIRFFNNQETFLRDFIRY